MQPTTEDPSSVTYKIVLIGDSGVGKSNLLCRYTKDTFISEIKSTLGVEFACRTLTLPSHTIVAQIWDTAGQERYSSITKAYYKGAVAALIVYDITKQSSFTNIEKWLRELRDHAEGDVAIGLIGNKCDLKQIRAVNSIDAARFSEENGMIFMETSALDGTNVEEAFEKLIQSFVFAIIGIESKVVFDHGRKPIVTDEKVHEKAYCCCCTQ